ncbi:MAG: P-loop NTPase [Anaerolineales bacterium]|nr:P-loop NTPase [Anaerolineales bacterium]
MSPTINAPSRVFVIADPGPTQQQVTAALSAEAEFDLADLLTSPDRLVREVRAAEPDIMLIDQELGGQPTLDIIDDIALQFPDIALVAILPENDPLVIQQVMLAGARAFIVQPFTQVNLLSTLRRVRELESRRTQSHAAAITAQKVEAERPLRTLAVYSPRGGVGCSTLAANLAISIFEEARAEVLLMEGKLFFGHLDVMLNIRTRNTIADLVPHAAALDENLIQDVVTGHVSGIDVLLGPSDVQVAQGIRSDDLYTVYMGLQSMYDYTVVDAGSSISENTVTLLDSVDRILLVTTPDLAALHDTSRFVQVSRSLGYPAEKMLIVLNRAGIPGGVKAGDIETALHHEVFAQIPDDGPNALRSLNRGIPLILRYPRSPASRAIKSLAKSLAEMRLTAPGGIGTPVGTLAGAHQEALLASSRMG